MTPDSPAHGAGGEDSTARIWRAQAEVTIRKPALVPHSAHNANMLTYTTRPIRESRVMTDTEAKRRRSIPAPLKRSILVEAGHRCAIPTCRHINVEVHHIIPWKQCQEHDYDNLIALCPNCHARADRGDIDRPSLRLYKRNLQFMHDKFSNYEIDILFRVFKLSEDHALDWPPFLDILINRILDAKLVRIIERPSRSVSTRSMQISPNHLVITDEGRRFVERIRSEEIF